MLGYWTSQGIGQGHMVQCFCHLLQSQISVFRLEFLFSCVARDKFLNLSKTVFSFTKHSMWALVRHPCKYPNRLPRINARDAEDNDDPGGLMASRGPFSCPTFLQRLFLPWADVCILCAEQEEIQLCSFGERPSEVSKESQSTLKIKIKTATLYLFLNKSRSLWPRC